MKPLKENDDEELKGSDTENEDEDIEESKGKRKRSKQKKPHASARESKVEQIIENDDEESQSIDAKVINLNNNIKAYPLPDKFDRNNAQDIQKYFVLNEKSKEHKIYRFGTHGSRFVSNNQLKNEDGSFQALVDGQPIIFDSSFNIREWTADKKANIRSLSELIFLWTNNLVAVSEMELVEIEGLSNFSCETKLKLTE